MPKFEDGQRIIADGYGAGMVIEVANHGNYFSYAIDFDDGRGFWCAEAELEPEQKP